MLKAFTYCDAKGKLGAFEIGNFSETETHYQGFLTDGGGIRTFRKDRVIEYHDSLDAAEAAIPTDYIPPERPAPAPRSKQPTICFTGFKKDIKAELSALAESAELAVRDGVSSRLAFLCCGANAGPIKLEKARLGGALILSEMQFRSMLSTGEIPEHDDDFHYTSKTITDKNAETEETKALADSMVKQIADSITGLKAIPRRETLIAVFVDGFAAGWKFAVPDVLRPALDIKLTSTVVHGASHDCWTQGHAFDFARGTMIYSDRIACVDWKSFIHKPGAVAINIFASSPAGFDTRNQLYGEFTGNYINSNISQQELTAHRIEVNKQFYDPGSVVFDVIRYQEGKVSSSERVTLTQVEFAALLQHGHYWEKPQKEGEKPKRVALID